MRRIDLSLPYGDAHLSNDSYEKRSMNFLSQISIKRWERELNAPLDSVKNEYNFIIFHVEILISHLSHTSLKVKCMYTALQSRKAEK